MKNMVLKKLKLNIIAVNLLYSVWSRWYHF